MPRGTVADLLPPLLLLLLLPLPLLVIVSHPARLCCDSANGHLRAGHALPCCNTGVRLHACGAVNGLPTGLPLVPNLAAPRSLLLLQCAYREDVSVGETVLLAATEAKSPGRMA